LTNEAWRILFMGTPLFACVALQRLLESEDTLVGVFTQPDRPQGRGRKVKVSPVKKLVEESGIPVYQPPRINQDEPFELIKKLSPDLIVVAAFGQILSQRILDVPKSGCINVHASILPKYRGSAPINRAIIQGEKTTGITTMLMDKGLDTGDILMQRETDILPEENAGELHDRLAALGAETLIETIKKWKKKAIIPVKQEKSKSTLAPPLKKYEGRIDWAKSAEIIHNQVRGMNPRPGAYTFFEGKGLKIFRTAQLIKDSHEKPGTVLKTTDEGILVSAGENCLLLKEIQLEGRKRMSAALFLRGNPVPLGNRLDLEKNNES